MVVNDPEYAIGARLYVFGSTLIRIVAVEVDTSPSDAENVKLSDHEKPRFGVYWNDPPVLNTSTP